MGLIGARPPLGLVLMPTPWMPPTPHPLLPAPLLPCPEPQCWFRIDDGPFFQGLKNMLVHYNQSEDGLPTCLTGAVQKRTSGYALARPHCGCPYLLVRPTLVPRGWVRRPPLGALAAVVQPCRTPSASAAATRRV